MSGETLHTMGQQHGRRSWAEPWKIKMVEPLRMTTREDREAALTDAGYNTFLLRSDDVYIDLLTDSGTSAMSDRQWAGMMLGDEAYAGSRNFYHLEAAVQRYYGYKHMLPTHQGRGAEHLISQTLIKAGDHIPGNMYFTTTRLHQELAGRHLPRRHHRRGARPAASDPVQGQRRPGQARGTHRRGRRGADPVREPRRAPSTWPGGQPVSMANVRALRALCDRHGIKLMLDATRMVENALFIQEREAGYADTADRRDPARVLLLHRRRLDEREEGQPRQHRRLAGGQRPGGVRGAAQPRGRVRGPAHVRWPGRARHGGTRDRHRGSRAGRPRPVAGRARFAISASCSRSGTVPIVQPIGGHAIFLDATRFYPHLAQDLFPAQTLAAELYLDSGIRSMERGIASAGRDPETGDHHRPKLELTRLTIPRRVYTQAHMDVVAESVKTCFDARDSARGLRMVYEPKYLRFFQARFEPI